VSRLVQHVVEGIAAWRSSWAPAVIAHARHPARLRVPRRRAHDDPRLEAGDPLTTDACAHLALPRCGTEFLVVVIILSIFAFSSLAGRARGDDREPLR
jgi:hypothetical protein